MVSCCKQLIEVGQPILSAFFAQLQFVNMVVHVIPLHLMMCHSMVLQAHKGKTAWGDFFLALKQAKTYLNKQ